MVFCERKLIAPDASYQAKGYRPVPSGQKLEYMCSYARATDANGESFIYCRTWQGQFFRFKLEDRVYDYVTTLPNQMHVWLQTPTTRPRFIVP